MSLPRLLRFLEMYSFDPQIYLVVRRADGGEEEIMHRRGQNRVWHVRSRGAELPWLERDAEGMLHILESRKADLQHLEKELLSLVMLNVVHGEQMRQEALEMFGPAGIEAAVQQFEEMAEQLKGAILHALNPDRPKTPPAAQGEKAQTEPQPRLRLIRPSDEPR